MGNDGAGMRWAIAAAVCAALACGGGGGGGGGGGSTSGGHVLTVTASGAGNGTVASNPAGIDCGFTCTASFAGAASVTVTATPAAGSTFAGWGGACTGTGACVVTMDADRTVTASFVQAPPQHSLTVSVAGSGGGTVTSSPAGIDCGSACTASFVSGTSVTLTATPASGSTFGGWSGACTGMGACVVALDADRPVAASFVLSGSTCETPGGRLHAGEYFVDNNTYMNSEAQPPAHPVTDFTQCASLEAGSTAGTLKASWTWSWPHQTNPDERITRATPGINYGFGPWDAASTTPNLPRRVAEISALTVDADVAQTKSANEDSFFGVVMYLTTSNQRLGTDPLPIARRFFVYRNLYPEQARSPKATQISIGGIEWDLEVTPDYVMYYPHADRDVPATALHLDLAAFMADALARGEIQSSWWVASVATSLIIQEGEGSLVLDNYRVQVQTPPHDRPAKTSRRVVYGPGPDGQYATEDDVVAGYNQVVFQENGNSLRDAWYFGEGASGADGTWFTDDDQPQGYWNEKPDHGFSLSGPGADGIWFNDDDVVASWEKFGTPTGTGATNVIYGSAGTDGIWFNGDDVVSQYHARTLDANGAEVRRVTYVDPGPDGIWFNGDDVPSSGGYWEAVYTGGNNRWGSWDMQLQFVDPGPDGVWLTDDDVMGSYKVHVFGDGSEYWTEEVTLDAGPDGKWFTLDDRVTGYARATNTY